MLHLSYYYYYLYDDRTDCINNLLSNLKRRKVLFINVQDVSHY